MFKHTLKPNVASVDNNVDGLYFQQSVTDNGNLASRTVHASPYSDNLKELDKNLTGEEESGMLGKGSGHKIYRDRIVSWHKKNGHEVVNVWAMKETFVKAGLLGSDRV